MREIISDVHDLEVAMAYVLADTARYNARVSDFIASTLWSDYALDVVSIHEPENLGHPFLWHVHNAGTYLHYMDIHKIEVDYDRYLKWKGRFLAFDDWTFNELNYKWGFNIHKSPVERIYYYDGKTFREVSRNTALLIWQYTGLELIRQHENALMEGAA